MLSTATRRDFFRATTAGLWGLTTLGPAGRALAAQVAEQPVLTSQFVQFTPDMEPLIRKIEETPEERCFEMAVAELRRGVGYRQFLAAVFLAGIREVNPQPPGFKLHCVFAIHAAHQLSLDAAPQDRLLPLFWSLAEFKKSQAEDVRLGDFRLRSLTGPLPAPEQAWSEFHAAMEAWDEPRADLAIVALARTRGAHEVIEGLWRYGARDYRNIGHKAIFVANAWRTLQTIGWRHAEPVLRSLVRALLDFQNREVNGYTFEAQSYRPNVERVAQRLGQLPAGWTLAQSNSAVTRELLEVVRTGDAAAASETALRNLADGSATTMAVWDAVHLASAELMMRQPGIYGIHTVTSVNALHYAYRAAAEPAQRLLLTLQGLGWMCQFRNYMAAGGRSLNATQITDLSPADLPAEPSMALDAIFGKVAQQPAEAAALALACGQRGDDLAPFADRVRGLVLKKPADAHHYKYAAAMFEDLELVSPEWRPQMLATAVYYLPDPGQVDSGWIDQVRAALS